MTCDRSASLRACADDACGNAALMPERASVLTAIVMFVKTS